MAAVTTAKNADSGLDPGAAYAAVLFYLLSYSLVSVGAFTSFPIWAGRANATSTPMISRASARASPLPRLR